MIPSGHCLVLFLSLLFLELQGIGIGIFWNSSLMLKVIFYGFPQPHGDREGKTNHEPGRIGWGWMGLAGIGQDWSPPGALTTLISQSFLVIVWSGAAP